MTKGQRQIKTGPYTKVNAYTQKFSLEQIFSAIFFFTIITLHAIFIVPPIVSAIKHPVLIFLMSLQYTLILVIAYDYIFITVTDPVDSLVNKTAQADLQHIDQIKKCIICNCFVFVKSYHCMRCNRCTENFDHHCKYLNNCIGGKNYENFLRILLILTIYFLLVIAQAVWVFIQSYTSNQMQNYMISRWPVLAVIVLLLIILIGVDSLLIYHFYLTLFRKMTTLEYIFRETPSNQSESPNLSTSAQRQTQSELCPQSRQSSI